MQYLLVNPHSGHGETAAKADAYFAAHRENARLFDLTEVVDIRALLAELTPDDAAVVFGGDGTLNRLINDVPDLGERYTVLYYPSGTGNDFCLDIGRTAEEAPFPINEYLKNLPTATVNGKSYRFINGVGYGIDGYCCEVGDKCRAEGKKANYTAIAIKGLLFFFKPRNATVTVDGVTRTYKKVWIAPTMFGRHYGGGMIPTPEQSRNGEEKTLSLMLFHGSGKLRTLTIFPSIFKGEHVKHTKYVEVLTGRNITVRFDRPTPLQIDGETFLNVTEYTATADSAASVLTAEERETATV